MRSTFFLMAIALGATGCASGGYTSAEVIYAEPADHVYVVPVDRVVVVTREVLVSRGWVVYRVERRGPDRVIWARRGDDDVVRFIATPNRDRVVVRGLWEVRERGERGDRGKHRGWVRRGPPPHDVFAEIDVRLRSR